MRIKPFRDGDTFTTFRNVIETVVREIDNLENEYILKASPAELEQYYVAKVTIAPVILDAENFYIEEQKTTQLDVSHDFSRFAFRGERIVVPGTALHVAIPYTGDKMLWQIRPSTFSLSVYPEIDVKEDVVVVVCSFPDDSVNTERLKADILHKIQSLADTVRNLALDVNNHNQTAPAHVQAALSRKRQKAEGAVGAVAALGIPFRRRDQPPTFAAPTRRRESPVTRPSVMKETFKPEPVLDEQEYEHILGVLRSMSLVIERSPGSFASLDEEAIRTHFLLQLNGHYEGSATGETFNASGKTDILIRVKNRNIFIAECKFWRGPKSFGDAIDQLLGYLTWRDSKCALLVFNQTRDSSSVRQKMHEVVLARLEHRKTLAHDPNGDSRYVLIKKEEPGREIHLCTMVFDVPKPQPRDS